MLCPATSWNSAWTIHGHHFSNLNHIISRNAVSCYQLEQRVDNTRSPLFKPQPYNFKLHAMLYPATNWNSTWKIHGHHFSNLNHIISNSTRCSIVLPAETECGQNTDTTFQTVTISYFRQCSIELPSGTECGFNTDIAFQTSTI